MRGQEKYRNRAARLRQLNQQYTFELIAQKIGGNAAPAYLSQIATEVIQKGRKNPRSLSDDYASRIEQAFNLGEGWFDIPIENPETPAMVKEPGADYSMEEQKLIEKYRQLSPEDRTRLQAITDALDATIEKKPVNSQSNHLGRVKYTRAPRIMSINTQIVKISPKPIAPPTATALVATPF